MKNKNNIFDLVDEIIERKTREETIRRINEMYNDKHFIYSPNYKRNKKPFYVIILILFFYFLICILILSIKK
jgi:hypothetical protein